MYLKKNSGIDELKQSPAYKKLEKVNTKGSKQIKEAQETQKNLRHTPYTSHALYSLRTVASFLHPALPVHPVVQICSESLRSSCAVLLVVQQHLLPAVQPSSACAVCRPVHASSAPSLDIHTDRLSASYTASFVGVG